MSRLFLWYNLFMRQLRIYVDTSVIGGCCDEEFSEWSRALLRDFQKGTYKLVMSDLVIAEIQKAPAEVMEYFHLFENCSSEKAEFSLESYNLSAAYLDRKILTPKFTADATHIALAVCADVDALVSWNFKHIVHMDKIRLFNAVNLTQGYRSLQIFTPREVTRYGFQSS
ncbi:MAG: PIN domain protein [Candidatus Wallbacteria bacterium]|nr:PIN domain protein [Candidatus Wallbacteria bacterium]